MKFNLMNVTEALSCIGLALIFAAGCMFVLPVLHIYIDVAIFGGVFIMLMGIGMGSLVIGPIGTALINMVQDFKKSK